jgi:hypothetical protein
MPPRRVLENTFAALKKLFTPYADDFDLAADEPGRYYLMSRTARTKSGSPVWFGGVEIKKNYVSFHLIPVYIAPSLLRDVSPSLMKRMHGKSCFNFSKVEPSEIEELTKLTARSHSVFSGL